MPDVIKSPEADQPQQSPEVNFALVLSRMIDAVEQDPVQLRATVYELARIKLMEQFGREDAREVKRLVGALETAIHGVEAFSLQRDEKARMLAGPVPNSDDGGGLLPAPPGRPEVPAPRREVGATDREPPAKTHERQDAGERHAEGAPPERGRAGAFAIVMRLCVVLAVVVLACAGALYWSRIKPLLPGMASVGRGRDVASDKAPAVVQPLPQAMAAGERAGPAPVSKPGFPLPSTFGIYALSEGELQELKPLPGKVPDQRVAMSAAINGPSQTTIPNGHAKFIVFRRDGATNAPDQAEVRVIAKVTRALAVDPSGKAVVAPAQDSWVIRNISVPYKVGPVDGRPEMYLVQPQASDLVLPPGRYVLVIKGQGFDFTVDGGATDPRHCVERVDAVNGAFYSPCPDRR